MHLDTRSRPKRRRGLILFAVLTVFAVGVILAFVPLGLDNINPDSSLTVIPVNGSQGGRVNGLKVDPSDNQIAYAASEWGGIFKTEDGADTWTHLDGHLPQATFDVDVGANGVVYATSLYDGRVDSLAGINVSFDDGATWFHPNVPDTSPSCGTWDQPSAFGISIDPDDPTNVFVGTACGIAVSTNSGLTWTHVDPDPATNARRIWDVEAQSGGIVDICGTDGHHRSVDSGQSWSPSNPGPNALPTGGDTCSVAVSPLENDVIFVIQNSRRLWESGDGGVNWTPLEDGLGNRRPFVVTNQTGPNDFELFYGTGPQLRQVAGCDDTTLPTRCPAGTIGEVPPVATLGVDVTNGAHADTGDLEFDPTGATPQCPYLFSNDGGVYRSDDCGTTWDRAMAGLHDLWLFDLTVAPLPGNQTGVYFGLMDSGLWHSLDGGTSWDNPECCDIWDVMADADRLIYSKCCPTTILRMTPADDPNNISPMNPPPQGWLQWFQLRDSMAPFATDSYVFVTQLEGNALFEDPHPAGPGGIWITQDVGASYTELGAASTPANACGVEVAVSAGVPTFYVITDDNLNTNPNTPGLCSGRAGGRLWKYTGTDPNGNWTAADAGLTAVGIFGVDPTDPNRLYASDLTASGPRMVFSIDGGASWNPDTKLDTLMTANGEFLYANTLGPEVRWFTPPTRGYNQPAMVTYHPTDPNVILASANDSGLFLTTDAGQSWVLVTDELPRVYHAEFDPFDPNVVYLGTVGRGAWKLTLLEADLIVTKSDAPDPAVAGEQLTYTIEVENDGPDPAQSVTVIDTLPEGVSYASDTGNCEQGPVGVLTCELGDMLSGDQQQFTITVDVDADLVFNAGAPTTITNEASVTAIVVDPDPDDNTVTEDTDVVAVADLEILSFTAIDPPDEILIGEDVQVTLRKVITNNGPSAPMNVKLTTLASAAPGTTVTPELLELEEPALALDEERPVDEVFTLSCQEPSMHSFEFVNTIEPLDPLDTDPDLSNNEATIQIDVECVVPVAINISPRSFPNSLNLRGVIPVAVLSTAEGEYGLPVAFDATTIDPSSVLFGPEDDVWQETGGASRIHKQDHIEDAFELDETTKDGDDDRLLHFKADETGIQVGDVEACVKGSWEDEGGFTHKFFGCDSIVVRPME